jgi:hypothetical protein
VVLNETLRQGYFPSLVKHAWTALVSLIEWQGSSSFRTRGLKERQVDTPAPQPRRPPCRSFGRKAKANVDLEQVVFYNYVRLNGGVVELVRNESTILLLHPLLFTFHLQVKSNGDGSLLVISFFQ